MKHIISFGFIIMLLASCKGPAPEQPKADKPQSDTYTFIKYSFYEDGKGNLYEKKSLAIDNINQERRHFFDSTMFFGEYPNQKALNKVIDIGSFQEYEDSPFSRDRNHVYYVQATSDGHKRFIVEQANPETFKPLEYRWGKDDKNVFWQTDIVEGIDLTSFKVNPTSTDSASDKNSIFVNGDKLE